MQLQAHKIACDMKSTYKYLNQLSAYVQMYKLSCPSTIYYSQGELYRVRYQYYMHI